MLKRNTPRQQPSDREAAIEEMEWYDALVRRKLRTWGRWLDRDHKRILTDNFDA